MLVMRKTYPRMSNIIINFPQSPNVDRTEIYTIVSGSLQSLERDISSWNAYVEMRNTDNGHYMLIAKCDNEELRSKMQWLLNIELNRRNAA